MGWSLATQRNLYLWAWVVRFVTGFHKVCHGIVTSKSTWTTTATTWTAMTTRMSLDNEKEPKQHQTHVIWAIGELYNIYFCRFCLWGFKAGAHGVSGGIQAVGYCEDQRYVLHTKTSPWFTFMLQSDSNPQKNLQIMRADCTWLVLEGLCEWLMLIAYPPSNICFIGLILKLKNVSMSYINWECNIVMRYNIKLIGWPTPVKFTSPSEIGTVDYIHLLCQAFEVRDCKWMVLRGNSRPILRHWQLGWLPGRS